MKALFRLKSVIYLSIYLIYHLAGSSFAGGGRGDCKFQRPAEGIALWGLCCKPFAASHDMDLAGRGQFEFQAG